MRQLFVSYWQQIKRTYPALFVRKYHVWGIGFALYPFLISIVAIYDECHVYAELACGLFLSMSGILSIPWIMIIFPVLADLLNLIFPESFSYLLAILTNPLLHYLFGMWIGSKLKDKCPRFQNYLFTFLIATPLIFLFGIFLFG